MLTNTEIEIRKKIWFELSEFYLDTDLGLENLKRKAKVFKESGLDINTIKEINFYEVAPILIDNLRSNTGIWDEFDQERIRNILEIKSRNIRNKPKKIFDKIEDFLHRLEVNFYTKRYLKKIEFFLNQ
ncbi:MAG: hypothetical protein IPN93_01880 [Bacteroidetes bacterium]|nr:hypothetical protein [Bacteroidota bacterium]